MSTPNPPTTEQFTAAASQLALPRDALHVLTFTRDADTITVDVIALHPDDVAHSLELTLRAFAARMDLWRATGFYDAVVGYGLADPDAGLIWLADRHGQITRIPTESSSTAGTVDEAGIGRGLIAMITAGPGPHRPDPVDTADA